MTKGKVEEFSSLQTAINMATTSLVMKETSEEKQWNEEQAANGQFSRQRRKDCKSSLTFFHNFCYFIIILELLIN